MQGFATGLEAVPIRWLDEIDSTNAEARRLAEAGEPGPLWIAARRQIQGRGRRGRDWRTFEGNLAATLLASTRQAPSEAATLSFVAGLAVADMAATYVEDGLVRLKWPNDVLLARAKLAGILIESGRLQDGRLWLAIGVGVNLATAPEIPDYPATALATHLRPGLIPPTPEVALIGLSAAMSRRIGQWLADGFAPIREAWLARAHGMGRACVARLGEANTLEGFAEGLDRDGALLLRLATGELRRITAGDVFFGGRLMLLAIEQGNTNTKFAVHDGSDWLAQWRTATEAARTADEYAVWLSQLMSLQDLKLSDLDACIIATVVPQSLFNLRNLARRYLKVDPLVIGENAQLGFPVRIDKPSEAGADRIVSAAGAHAIYPGALIVVGSGTATTFDVVAEDGGLEGCAIAPGINLSMEALHSAAAKLPRVAIQRPARAIGKDTVESMQAGVYWGYIALIEGMIERIKAEFGRPMTVIATGGVASLFHGATDKIDVFDPDVTIRGLLEIWRYNRDLVG